MHEKLINIKRFLHLPTNNYLPWRTIQHFRFDCSTEPFNSSTISVVLEWYILIGVRFWSRTDNTIRCETAVGIGTAGYRKRTYLASYIGILSIRCRILQPQFADWRLCTLINHTGYFDSCCIDTTEQSSIGFRGITGSNWKNSIASWVGTSFVNGSCWHKSRFCLNSKLLLDGLLIEIDGILRLEQTMAIRLNQKSQSEIKCKKKYEMTGNRNLHDL